MTYMKRQDYNFSEYQSEVNKVAYKILKESYADEFDAQDVSDQIDEAQVTYNKIQKILNTPEMIKSHAYLYSLDMENVDECDKQKIDKLYELGKARGVIQEDEPAKKEDVDECGDGDDAFCGSPDDALTNQEMTPGQTKPASTSAAFTVLYSAMKDGQVKTGEFFSSATSMDAAKTDCIDNLMPLGYSSIRVLGIEQTNNAVDAGTLSEDDSEEYENQETGAGDTANAEKQADGEKTQTDDAEKQNPDEKTDGGEENKDATGSEETKTEEPKDGEETADGDDENAEDGGEKKLTAAMKQDLKDQYIGIFKGELQKMKLEKSVEEMTVKEKAEFWGNVAKKWTKEDPEEFMSAKDIEKLNKIVVKIQ